MRSMFATASWDGDGDPDVVAAAFDDQQFAWYESRILVDQAAPCPADADGDGTVGILDFLALLAEWGPCPTPCSADTDDDGEVGILDFLAVLANWGACP